MDIQLCSLAILRAADKLSARWRFALMLVGGVRRWFFLPSLVISVPTLVMWRGGKQAWLTLVSLIIARISRL